jgi:hypothetical protein
MADRKRTDAESVWKEYQKGLAFNTQQDLYATVRTNENFFVGKQWEGVVSGGLPTPVFNFLKRVVLFTVAGITSNNIKLQASVLGNAPGGGGTGMETSAVNREFEALFEQNRIVNLLREYLRNAAVDGDGCTYTYWDPAVDTGQPVKGAIVTEVIENTRVFFGNVNNRRVQKQPYILITSREMLSEVRDRARDNGCADPDAITADTDDRNTDPQNLTDDKVTVLLKLWRNKDTGTVWGIETTKNAVIKGPWDLGLALYPVTWLNWDYVQDSYHGQAMITGLIPNQVFINKLFAMSMISLMTTAYPKIVYDRTRVARWDNRVGAAIPVNGGDVNSVARIIDPAQVSPQIAQFIELAVGYTQNFLGATSVALGDTRPDNTSAIIALQRAAATPNELTRQNLFESLEDLGRIYIDFMANYYGERQVLADQPEGFAPVAAMADIGADEKIPVPFDFGRLKGLSLSLKLDVGASAYWSEIASMQTLDNLLVRGKIDLIDYLERVPNGYITKQQELVDKLKETQAAKAQQMQMPQNPFAPTGAAGKSKGAGQVIATSAQPPIPTGGGYAALQRSINKTGLGR